MSPSSNYFQRSPLGIFLPSYINIWSVVFEVLCGETHRQTHTWTPAKTIPAHSMRAGKNGTYKYLWSMITLSCRELSIWFSQLICGTMMSYALSHLLWESTAISIFCNFIIVICHLSPALFCCTNISHLSTVHTLDRLSHISLICIILLRHLLSIINNYLYVQCIQSISHF